ncbi:hypothetical protein [Exiguobacterium sp. R-39]|uniref:hypothetical protein n=1 Tax=Exiguobacterium sp. R-39 TaxID=3416708 RepID=UPI003CF09A99
MKTEKSKFYKSLNYFSIILITIALVLFGVTYWLNHKDNEPTIAEKEETTVDEEVDETDSATTDDDELTEEEVADAQVSIDAVENDEESTTYEDPDTYVTDEQKQVYAEFYPQFQVFSTKYDSAWDELWGPAIEMAETDPDGAISLLTSLAAAYDVYGQDLRDLPFPSELDEGDASDFDLATDEFADAMDERQTATIFAAASIKQGTFTSDATTVFLNDAATRTNSKMHDVAATINNLSTKYGYTQ